MKGKVCGDFCEFTLDKGHFITGDQMTIDTKTMVSISDANQNFSKVARLVDECGSAVILKNNVPRYLVIDFSKADKDFTASDEDVLSISKQLMEQNKEAYEVLAK